ncbi:MAG TPA: LemA family protein [Verrucomicrobiae bacterium]|jgi:LemA protein
MTTGIILAEPATLALAGLGIAIVVLIIIAVIAVIFIAFVVGVYNKLVTMRNRYKNAYAQIDVQLKRRYDLIPNLVETAKGYIKHERETLEAVTAARNIAYAASKAAAANPGDATAMKSLGSAETGLSGTLSRLMMVSEAYPDLKANQNMMQLTEELTSTENKISFARQAYNDSVMTYNTDREVFPSNLIAGMFNFTAAELFVVDKPEQKDAPKVSFS